MMARELQLGDPGGAWKRQFGVLAPLLRPALRPALWGLYGHYHIPGGKKPGKTFAKVPAPQIDSPLERSLLTLAANFAEARRAKEGHDRPVGINYLRKIELQMLPGLLGAILAGVDYVAVGAGDPAEIPGLIRRLCALEPVKLPVKVAHAETGRKFFVELDPRDYLAREEAFLGPPKFLAIIGSHLPAEGLAGNEDTRPDGFIVENDSAGGHNAPPIGGLKLGPVVWGPQDIANNAVIAGLGLPFWLAGGFGSAEGLRAAIRLGAAGVQIGTPFALATESGMDGRLRLAVLKQIWRRQLRVE
ncbi:MAG: nitronate monooxygenase, partial [Solirubrobacteraceae bacterium]